MFRQLNKQARQRRALEEQIYEVVATELRDGIRKDGLWLKALSRSKGDEKAADALYVKLRFQSILDEYGFELEKAQNELRDRKTVAENRINVAKEVPELKNTTASDSEIRLDKEYQSTDPRVRSAIDDLRARGCKVYKDTDGRWIVVPEKGERRVCSNVNQLEGCIWKL